MKARQRPDLLSRSNLTRAQLLIWTGQQLHADAPLYNMAFTFAIEGALDPHRFQSAFDRLVRCCDALRTVVETRDGVPYQRVVDAPETVPASLELIDLSTAPEPLTASRSLEQTRCARNLDLDRSVFDSALIKLSERRFRWFFLQHHIVTDAWSFGVLFRRLEAFYSALSRPSNRAAPVAAPLAAFADYVAHERKSRRARNEGETAADAAESLVPGTSGGTFYGQRPTRVSTRSVRLGLDLGRTRSDALRSLAQRPEARALTLDLSLFNLLATALFAFLHRISGTHHLAIGAPFHNRTTLASRDIAGLFTEVLPVTVEVASGDSFLTLLGKVQGATQAFLRRATAGAGSAHHHRGLSAILNFIRGSFSRFDGATVDTEWIHPGHHDREHPLRLHVHDFAGTGRLGLLFDFNADRFDDQRRSDAVGHFERLLDALIADWTQPITHVDLLSAAERRQQLVLFNVGTSNGRANGDSESPPTRSVVTQILAQATATPDAIAIGHGHGHGHGHQRLSYGALAGQIEYLAARLHQHNDATAPRPMVVGISMRRSAEAVVAMLGVLRAGATYVPLDPSDPSPRRARMCLDAGVSLLLVGREHADDLVTDTTPSLPTLVVTIDERAPHASGTKNGYEPGNGYRFEPLLDAPAYVLFTSGSTGHPKGVVVSHRALGHYVAWACSHYGDGLTFPLFSPLTFDLTVTSIFVPLVSGGTVVVYPETSREADLALLDVVADLDPVDIIKLTPSHLDLLTEQVGAATRVDQLIFGGEALTWSHIRRARACFGDQVIIHNEYGPTEATVGCVVHTVEPRADQGGDQAGAQATGQADDAIPIGRPIARMRAYVLDSHLALVPAGTVGDLYLAGAGLAQGYAGGPAQTAERFLPDPFDPFDPLAPLGGGGARLYRTGDRARFTAANRLVYVGRVDDQVKVRGARVELAEVETALRQHPRITACVACVAQIADPASAWHAATHESAESVRHCQRCGLASSYPDAGLDATDLCRLCRAFEQYRDQVARFFKSPDDLRAILDSEPASTPDGYDCLALLSGGKDSTYVLCQLVDMGYKVLAFTLDNGFLSEQAMANIVRVAKALGVDHIFGSTPAMKRIFVDSLERHANVCQGCFKTIYTLSMKLAQEKSIPFIVTGLSRGQFFETRLTEDLFTNPALDVEAIDGIVLEARKAYHRVDDAVRRLLDVSMFDDDAIFEQVRFVDFYRYWPVDLDAMYAYLDARVPWVRPTDTGRSTNCLINDVGIFVHQRQRGFHNYALPYSWDVRMGHKTRDAALEELDDEIDTRAVEAILEEIDYPHDVSIPESERRLVVYYTAPSPIATSELRRHAVATLPAFMVPSSFIHLPALPLTRHGKVDRAALPALSTLRAEPEASFVAPRDETERTLATIWAAVLRRERVGVHDNYFELGGDSIMAIQIVARCHRQGLSLVPAQLFEALTVAGLARVAQVAITPNVAHQRATGAIPLLPAQAWFLDHVLPEALTNGAPHWHHELRLDSSQPLDAERLRASLHTVAARHDAFRLRFHHDGDQWQAELVEDAGSPTLHVVNTSKDPAAGDTGPRSSVDLGQAPLLEATLVLTPEGRDRLILTAHHLVVDVVSWSVIVDDLTWSYQHSATDDPVTLPALPASSTHSLASWSRARTEEAHADDSNAANESDHWRAVIDASVPAIPTDATDNGTVADSDEVRCTLERAQTALLLADVPKTGRLRVHEALMTALALTLASWTKTHRVRFFAEAHGRDAVPGLDASQTVGWLANLYPVILALPDDATTDATMRAMKDQLRAIPRNGAGYGTLRSRLLGERLDRCAFEARHVVFNYLGRAEQLTMADDLFTLGAPLKLVRGQRAHRPFVIEIDAMVVDDRLTLTWTYGRHRHRRATIENQAQRFLDHIRAIIECALTTGGIAASDFPHANLDDDKLRKLAAALRGS